MRCDGCHRVQRVASEALDHIDFLVLMDTGLDFAWFCANAQAMFEKTLAANFGGQLGDGSGVDVLEELEGIVEGANANRPADARALTLTDLLGWNGYPELICPWFPAVMAGQIQPAVALPKDTPTGLHLSARRRHFRFGNNGGDMCACAISVAPGPAASTTCCRAARDACAGSNCANANTAASTPSWPRAWLRGHMKDRPTQPWTAFAADTDAG